ncbi:GNAT family N-acetyltransferase [Hydrogenophaga sp. R2]|uniref:GNAT family N-acetyltransferase n=1 Tax=Hydrogenophaga sp. R2 TaxID=3132827 RepID=UPI003CED409E
MSRPDPAALVWRCLPFDALQAHTLYAILRLRSEVFVVEQRCVFQDMDGADADCMHLLGESPDPAHPAGPPLLRAYARLVPAGRKFAEASIGRVVSDPALRGTGVGHALMAQAVQTLTSLWGRQPIRIGAQAHLQGFYRRHGFETASPVYDEDGIDHVEMLRP